MNRNVWPLTVCNQNTVGTVLQSSNSNMFHTSGSSANLGSTANFDSAEIDAGSSFQHNSTYPTQKQIKNQYSENIANRSIFCLYGCYCLIPSNHFGRVSSKQNPSKSGKSGLETIVCKAQLLQILWPEVSDSKAQGQNAYMKCYKWMRSKKNHPLSYIWLRCNIQCDVINIVVWSMNQVPNAPILLSYIIHLFICFNESNCPLRLFTQDHWKSLQATLGQGGFGLIRSPSPDGWGWGSRSRYPK